MITIDELKRLKFLLLGAATAFEEGRDPFSTEWLRENEVSLVECKSLGEAIGFGIRFWVADNLKEY